MSNLEKYRVPGPPHLMSDSNLPYDVVTYQGQRVVNIPVADAERFEIITPYVGQMINRRDSDGLLAWMRADHVVLGCVSSTLLILSEIRADNTVIEFLYALVLRYSKKEE